MTAPARVRLADAARRLGSRPRAAALLEERARADRLDGDSCAAVVTGAGLPPVFADEELHLWTFDDAGLVRRFRHHLDTAKQPAATGAVDTTQR